jgi:hypothetical protein
VRRNRETPPAVALGLVIGLTIRAANNNPAALAAAVRSEIRASDAGLPIFSIRTMEDLRRERFWQFRVFAYMCSSRAPRSMPPPSDFVLEDGEIEFAQASRVANDLEPRDLVGREGERHYPDQRAPRREDQSD